MMDHQALAMVCLVLTFTARPHRWKRQSILPSRMYATPGTRLSKSKSKRKQCHSLRDPAQSANVRDNRVAALDCPFQSQSALRLRFIALFAAFLKGPKIRLRRKTNRSLFSNRVSWHCLVGIVRFRNTFAVSTRHDFKPRVELDHRRSKFLKDARVTVQLHLSCCDLIF